MKFKIETEDPLEIYALTNASNMGSFIWDLVHNGWREFKHTDYEYEKAWKKINDMLDDYGIDPEKLG